jgi:hypothetical protein
MIARTPTLTEWPYRMVRLACNLALDEKARIVFVAYRLFGSHRY